MTRKVKEYTIFVLIYWEIIYFLKKYLLKSENTLFATLFGSSQVY